MPLLPGHQRFDGATGFVGVDLRPGPSLADVLQKAAIHIDQQAIELFVDLMVVHQRKFRHGLDPV